MVEGTATTAAAVSSWRARAYKLVYKLVGVPEEVVEPTSLKKNGLGGFYQSLRLGTEVQF